MRTARSIEEQEARKTEEKSKAEGKTGRGFLTQSSDPVSEGRRRRLANLKPFPKGMSGNPGGKPKVDLAAQIARAIFENDGPAIYAAYAKMLRKGSPYAFQVLSDRAFGKLKERHEVELGPYRDMSEDELKKRVKELEQQLGILPAHVDDQDDHEKPN
jgi:hypothetical protein